MVTVADERLRGLSYDGLCDWVCVVTHLASRLNSDMTLNIRHRGGQTTQNTHLGGIR